MKSPPPSLPASGKDSATPSPSAKDDLLGLRLGGYVLEERIGAGGMGVVYRATHPLIGKQVAIKVLRAELVSPEQEQRLLVEARAVNAIQHPGIIDIFDFGSLPDGRPYIIMELLKGQTLSTVLRHHRQLDVGRTLWILDQVLTALGAAHKAGIIHRDLKPANVFLVNTPDTAPSLKLVDFGIAKLLESNDGPTTASGMVLGTPEYMAPEQVRGDTVGPAADLYAVGLMAFQMLTGTRPFQGEPFQVMFAHAEKPPPRPSSLNPNLPSAVDDLVLRLLAKAPGERPESAEVVRQQLRDVLNSSTAEPEAAPLPDSSAPEPRHEPTTLQAMEHPPTPATLASQVRHPGKQGLIAVLLFICAIGAVGWMALSRGGVPPSPREPRVTASKPTVVDDHQPAPAAASMAPKVAEEVTTLVDPSPSTVPLKTVRNSKSPGRRTNAKSEVSVPTTSMPLQPPSATRTLEQQLDDVVVLLEPHGGVAALDKDLREELNQLRQSIRTATSDQEKGYLSDALNLWKRRMTQRMATRIPAAPTAP
jgi:eukaryotic-like serine/threonine-protein kinase